MDHYELSETQTRIIATLERKKRRVVREIDEEIREVVNLVRKTVGVGDDWKLKNVGTPQTGDQLILVPPADEAEDGEGQE